MSSPLTVFSHLLDAKSVDSLNYCPPNLSDHLCVFVFGKSTLEQTRAFADTLNLKLYTVDAVSDPMQLKYPYVFVMDGLHASIWQTGKGAPGPVTASFLQGKTTHRLNFGGGKGQMIAKAVGLNKGVVPRILDATAGLAQDAFVLASLGCEVRMLERSPIIAGLVSAALQEAHETELAEIIRRLSLIHTDATTWLTAQTDKVADVIYLDPMYPHREKAAQVKKEMKLFHQLVGEPSGDAELLEAALDKARYRVVVKRPRKGECISGRPPAHQLLGKSCRYDIYPLQRLENLK